MFCAIMRGEKYKRAQMLRTSTLAITVERYRLSMATPKYTTHSVYRLVNTFTGMCYVGQSITPDDRRRRHFRALKLNKHHSQYMQNTYNKYGVGSFYFEVLEKGISSADIDERERYWIKHFDSYEKGFNGSSGGDAVGRDGTPCTWNGIQYDSYSDAARAIGIRVDTMCWRFKHGYTCDTDMQRSYRRSIEWNGIEYESLEDCASALGIAADTLSKRVAYGYKGDADMQMEHEVSVEWNGIQYKSYLDCSKAIGVNPVTLRQRVMRGLKCDADIPTRGIPCEWNGAHYNSYKEAGKALGIDPSTMYDRVRHGHTCDADMNR